jgi:hypothetical protein
MPTRSWVSVVGCAMLSLTACAVARPTAQTHTAAETSILKVEAAGRVLRVRVALAPSEIDSANDHIVTPLGTRGSSLLVVDSYASSPEAMSRCQAGHETWLRLIDTRSASERWSKRVESCLHDIQPGDPIAEWVGTGPSFAVNLLSEPSLHITISPDGSVVTGN